MAAKSNFRPYEADRPYKWIRKEIEASDPYRDYEKIWRLSIEYTGGGEFMQSMIYALTFSNFVTNEWGAQSIWRDGDSKVVNRATARVYETQFHNSVWWFYGPHHPKTVESAEIINKRHEQYAKRYPGNFSHPADFTYTLCFTAISVHRLRQRLRLSGFTAKQKIAAHLFWKEMSRLFFVEQPGQPLQDWLPISNFPDSWGEMVSFCEDIEANHMKVTHDGHLIAEALFDHFAFRFFRPMLRPLGRALPITLSLPQTLKAHRIKPTHPILARILIFVIGIFIWFMETFMPDPKISTQETFQERARNAGTETRAHARSIDREFPAVFAKNHMVELEGCPFMISAQKN